MLPLMVPGKNPPLPLQGQGPPPLLLCPVPSPQYLSRGHHHHEMALAQSLLQLHWRGFLAKSEQDELDLNMKTKVNFQKTLGKSLLFFFFF